jgi:N-acetylneuraminate synthase
MALENRASPDRAGCADSGVTGNLAAVTTAALDIGGRRIGPDRPVFVIAEAGSNHNRDLAIAHRLVAAAADAGADAVKFQTFEADRLYPKSAGTSDYLGVPQPIHSLLAELELPIEWLGELRDDAAERGLKFLSTPFHVEAVGAIDPYVDAFKVASYELTHDPLLRAVADRGKPVLLSTGATALDEIGRAVDVLAAAGCSNPVLLQCTAAYPAPPESANVRALVTLAETFGLMTGLSDHTLDPIAAPAAAAALGAVVIEKHFTLDRKMTGPDHAYAIEPHELAQLIDVVRRVTAVRGDGVKRVHDVETELRHFAQRSVFTTCAVARGEPFTPVNVDVLRHGRRNRGLAPSELSRVLASVAARDLVAESPLQADDLAQDG